MKERRTDSGCAECAVVGELICVAGGFNGRDGLSSVEAYNTTTGKWIQGIPQMSKRKSGLSGESLNGELYTMGGGLFNGKLAKLYFLRKVQLCNQAMDYSRQHGMSKVKLHSLCL